MRTDLSSTSASRIFSCFILFSIWPLEWFVSESFIILILTVASTEVPNVIFWASKHSKQLLHQLEYQINVNFLLLDTFFFAMDPWHFAAQTWASENKSKILNVLRRCESMEGGGWRAFQADSGRRGEWAANWWNVEHRGLTLFTCYLLEVEHRSAHFLLARGGAQ